MYKDNRSNYEITYKDVLKSYLSVSKITQSQSSADWL